jgi:hypothetical protein
VSASLSQLPEIERQRQAAALNHLLGEIGLAKTSKPSGGTLSTTKNSAVATQAWLAGGAAARLIGDQAYFPQLQQKNLMRSTAPALYVPPDVPLRDTRALEEWADRQDPITQTG